MTRAAQEPWHALSPAEVIERLGSHEDGLPSSEAAARLARHGPNRLTAARPVSPWKILAAQFRSVVVLLLAAAAAVAFAIGDRSEALAIAAVLVVNTVIGFAVELKARREMEALLEHHVPETTVLRDGDAHRVPTDQVVPGDVVELAEGDSVPADARLLEAAEVHAAEAALTGESVPVQKQVEPVEDPEVTLPDRVSMVYTGTTIVAGSAKAVVVATGMDTELGRIGHLLAQIEKERTPLERRLDHLGTRLVWVTVGVTAVVVALGLREGVELASMLQTGLALAIAAVPEGLPAVATIALAVGLRRMARRQAAVRHLGAVEALGSTTLICTDKTGTLTAGEMTVTRVEGADFALTVAGAGFSAAGEIRMDGRSVTPEDAPYLTPLLRACALTARAHVEDGRATGDPTDAALLVLAAKAGLDREELLERVPESGELPFSSERGFSASYHDSPEGRVVFVKGAPGNVLDLCSRVATRDGTTELDGSIRAQIEERNAQLAKDGLRVIALAWSERASDDSEPEDLTFLGLAGIMDPPAEGVRETISLFREAGIRTVMITGDQAATATHVGRTIGLVEGEVGALHGREIARLAHAELVDAVARTTIFSRVTPGDKLDIVSAFQERGEIVAMLGDGVNDAAALKKADVSVAMGIRGTDLAKETADLVLRDDRFGTIGAAIEEGRIVYDNVRKFVFFLFSCNVAEILVVLGASLASLPLPLLPLQILWLNLVTDTFPALALAVEPGEPWLMRRAPRRPDAAILSRRFLVSLAFFAALITASSLGAFVWGLRTGTEARAVTLCFMTLAFAQLLHLGNARSRHAVLTFRRATANPWALAAAALVIALQLAAIYLPPLARVLGTVPLDRGDWLVVVGLALVPAVVGQLLRSRAPTNPMDWTRPERSENR